ncbi:hypothetical protein EPICR_60020 [Candidatus Desulfarcum epimagneticum]|uniref:Uncharacterized protein n=1 Tax=uncultured Desulfobacteraceae bacterium TaxID=218296 RepID=A0A484HP02_9BACT|nr:hypothetical protein EPICR_60020 [uncultured Desulfobacteraceae bacterium]
MVYTHDKIHHKESNMKDLLIVVAIIGLWYLMQAVILPKMGIST